MVAYRKTIVLLTNLMRSEIRQNHQIDHYSVNSSPMIRDKTKLSHWTSNNEV